MNAGLCSYHSCYDDETLLQEHSSSMPLSFFIYAFFRARETGADIEGMSNARRATLKRRKSKDGIVRYGWKEKAAPGCWGVEFNNSDRRRLKISGAPPNERE